MIGCSARLVVKLAVQMLQPIRTALEPGAGRPILHGAALAGPVPGAGLADIAYAQVVLAITAAAADKAVRAPWAVEPAAVHIRLLAMPHPIAVRCCWWRGGVSTPPRFFLPFLSAMAALVVVALTRPSRPRARDFAVYG